MKSSKHLVILGGGPAGLAVGYYAARHGIPFEIHESAERVGGNCITLKHVTANHLEFYFDSGAHRFHDKDPEITAEIKGLLGENLFEVNAPSLIYQDGNFYKFPLQPLDVLKNFGLLTSIRAGFEVIASRISIAQPQANFSNSMLYSYGRTIAEAFLLGYSEKLWGVPAGELDASIGGSRLEGLTLKTLLNEALLGSRSNSKHLEGSNFYYPKHGFGMIAQALADACGQQNIKRNSTVSKIYHSRNRLTGIELNSYQLVEVDSVVSTLPLPLVIKLLEPKPPLEILQMAERVKFRSLILVAIFINQPTVTNAATVYFPDPELPFTRIYEPRNRSPFMSPAGATSLIAEIPCQIGDQYWTLSDGLLGELVRSKLERLEWFKRENVIETTIRKIGFAYPTLSLSITQDAQNLLEFLGGFENSNVSGRSGKFVYSWLHDMMRFGKNIVEKHLTMDSAS